MLTLRAKVAWEHGNERVFRIPQSSSITEVSPSDCLVLYQWHSLCRNADSVFCSPNLTEPRFLRLSIVNIYKFLNRKTGRLYNMIRRTRIYEKNVFNMRYSYFNYAIYLKEREKSVHENYSSELNECKTIYWRRKCLGYWDNSRTITKSLKELDIYWRA